MKTLWEWILSLFGYTKKDTSEERENNNTYAAVYRDIDKINFTAMFSKKLAMIAMFDSKISIIGNNARSVFLGDVAKKFWRKAKKAIAAAFGTGGCLIVPYIKNGQLYYNFVSQDRFMINKMQGDKISDAIILADSTNINHMTYYRWVNYILDGDTVHIKNKTTDSAGKIVELDFWNDINDISISGVDRLLFGFLKSPVDNRRDSDKYGVPITYGCSETIEQIRSTLKQTADEFALKKVRMFADSRMFKRDKKGNPKLESDVFMPLEIGSNDTFIKEFSPAIRESSYYTRLNSLLEQLEHEVGTSKGILTPRETGITTATEIRASQMDTAAIVNAVREETEQAAGDFIYACNVLCNAYGLTPQGEYDISFDWSNAYLESTETEWQQIRAAKADGAISTAEERAWLKNETIEEAQAAVDEIAVREPNYNTLVGD